MQPSFAPENTLEIDSHAPLQKAISTIKPEYLSVFPSMDSLDEVLMYAQAQLPLDNSDSQKLFSLFMLYHNTLIKQIKPIN